MHINMKYHEANAANAIDTIYHTYIVYYTSYVIHRIPCFIYHTLYMIHRISYIVYHTSYIAYIYIYCTYYINIYYRHGHRYRSHNTHIHNHIMLPYAHHKNVCVNDSNPDVILFEQIGLCTTPTNCLGYTLCLLL